MDQTSHPCPECGRVFRKRANLKVHLRVHTGETPFPCNQCDKKFRWKASWVSHLAGHSQETLPCNQCDRKFVRKASWVSHLAWHRRMAARDSALDAATKCICAYMHREPPFPCNQCDKKFAWKTVWIMHVAWHFRAAASEFPFNFIPDFSATNAAVHAVADAAANAAATARADGGPDPELGRYSVQAFLTCLGSTDQEMQQLARRLSLMTALGFTNQEQQQLEQLQPMIQPPMQPSMQPPMQPQMQPPPRAPMQAQTQNWKALQQAHQNSNGYQHQRRNTNRRIWKGMFKFYGKLSFLCVAQLQNFGAQQAWRQGQQLTSAEGWPPVLDVGRHNRRKFDESKHELYSPSAQWYVEFVPIDEGDQPTGNLEGEVRNGTGGKPGEDLRTRFNLNDIIKFLSEEQYMFEILCESSPMRQGKLILFGAPVRSDDDPNSDKKSDSVLLGVFVPRG